MTIKSKGYAAQAAATPLAPFDFERRDPRPDDVVIRILYCGVCHSDLHAVENDWGNSIYPLVPGHEIVGEVTAVGAAVSAYQPGDLVGVGCMVDSCRVCPSCGVGEEQLCDERPTMTYNGLDRHDKTPTLGGYSDSIVVSERFVLNMPTSLDIKAAAPLLCAGITVWSPLRYYGVKAGSKVGIVGMGGLGHMAIKFAKALGAETTLISRSESKRAEAMALGADHFVISEDKDQMKATRGHFDLLIDTVPVAHDVNPYLPSLKVGGTHVLVGYIGLLTPPVHSHFLISGRKALAGSIIGGIKETQEMLDFCGEHNIVSDIEMITMQDINEAYKRLEKGDVRYRFVIDMSTL